MKNLELLHNCGDNHLPICLPWGQKSPCVNIHGE